MRDTKEKEERLQKERSIFPSQKSVMAQKEEKFIIRHS
jgi:hypothetical protein